MNGRKERRRGKVNTDTNNDPQGNTRDIRDDQKQLHSQEQTRNMKMASSSTTKNHHSRGILIRLRHHNGTIAVVQMTLMVISIAWVVCIAMLSSIEQQQQQQHQNQQQLQQQSSRSLSSVSSIIQPLSSSPSSSSSSSSSLSTTGIRGSNNNNNNKDSTALFSSSSSSSSSSASSSSSHNFTVAICLITSDGEAYFQEWVDYHLLAMKFDNIYVYDNSDKFELQRWHDNTRSHPIYSKVEIEHRPGPGFNRTTKKHLQSTVYEDCITRFGKDNNGPQHDYL
jgi:hypothetical protein